MKIVIQNGADHKLSRRVIEKLLPNFPTEWSTNVDTILVRATVDSAPLIEFYPSAKEISVCGPRTEGLLNSFLRELLIALSVIAERNELPRRIHKSLHDHHASLVDIMFLELRGNQ